ncbi:MAG TPA: ATP-binding protein [Bacteroidia bacterium]|nr:ATP-binding protein [Bacteroidia bacterium]
MHSTVIKIPDCRAGHLVEWLRFIIDARNKRSNVWRRHYTFDFTNADFLSPFHLVSLACVIEEYKQTDNAISFKYAPKSSVEKYAKYSKFDYYWRNGFDKDYCLSLQTYSNTMPIWQHKQEYVDTFGMIVQRFYKSHFKGKDLTSLGLTVVEALNNITDHANSPISGFVATQYLPAKSRLIIAICDFGVGIPYNVNQYLKKEGKHKLNDVNALEEALFQGFSTYSKPHNRGFGLDTILSNVKASNGEIQIVSNKAYYTEQSVNNNVRRGKYDLQFSFPGTYLIIKFDTSTFRPIEQEFGGELEVL